MVPKHSHWNCFRFDLSIAQRLLAFVTPVIHFYVQQLCRTVTPDQLDFIISPFSIWSLLVLLAEGAEGSTYTQLSKVLRLPANLTEIRTFYKNDQQLLMINNSGAQLSTNQVLFSDANRPIEIDFQYKLEHVYEADYQPVNFANPNETYNKINGYVKKKTGGRINEIVPLEELNQAQMILVSAIFFQGRWKVRTTRFSAAGEQGKHRKAKLIYCLFLFSFLHFIDWRHVPTPLFSIRSKVMTPNRCRSTMSTAPLCQRYK